MTLALATARRYELLPIASSHKIIQVCIHSNDARPHSHVPAALSTSLREPRSKMPQCRRTNHTGPRVPEWIANDMTAEIGLAKPRHFAANACRGLPCAWLRACAPAHARRRAFVAQLQAVIPPKNPFRLKLPIQGIAVSPQESCNY